MLNLVSPRALAPCNHRYVGSSDTWGGSAGYPADLEAFFKGQHGLAHRAITGNIPKSDKGIFRASGFGKSPSS